MDRQINVVIERTRYFPLIAQRGTFYCFLFGFITVVEKNKLQSDFYVSVLFLTINFAITLSK